MSADDKEDIDSTNDTTEEVDNTEDVEDTDAKSEAEDKPQYTEHEQKMFERAKKAEAEAKRLKAELAKSNPQTSQKQDGDLSTKDLYALMDAKVPQADVDEVVKAAKLLGKSIPEALEDGLVKARLSQLSELRKTSEVTNTSGSKRTSPRVTDEQVVDRMREGKNFDPDAVAEARINLKKQALKK